MATNNDINFWGSLILANIFVIDNQFGAGLLMFVFALVSLGFMFCDR